MAPTRRNFNLAAERAALIRSLKNAETNWYAMCRDFRDAGQYLVEHQNRITGTQNQRREVGIRERTRFQAMAGQVCGICRQMGRVPGVLEVVAEPELCTGTAPRLVGLFRSDGCQEAV